MVNGNLGPVIAHMDTHRNRDLCLNLQVLETGKVDDSIEALGN